MNIATIINELNLQIKAKYNDFRGSYLFGSLAKGNYNKDSDIDIVLIFDEINRDKQLDVYGIIGELNYKYDVIIIGMLYTKKQLKKNCIFYDEVVNKGVYYNAA